MQLSTTICVMLLFAHVAACTLVLAAKLEGLPEGSWMVQYGMAIVTLWYMLMHSESFFWFLSSTSPMKHA